MTGRRPKTTRFKLSLTAYKGNSKGESVKLTFDLTVEGEIFLGDADYGYLGENKVVEAYFSIKKTTLADNDPYQNPWEWPVDPKDDSICVDTSRGYAYFSL